MKPLLGMVSVNTEGNCYYWELVIQVNKSCFSLLNRKPCNSNSSGWEFIRAKVFFFNKDTEDLLSQCALLTKNEDLRSELKGT